MRDAIQTAKVPTIQGVVSFDENGDLTDRTVSVFQIKQDDDSVRPDDVSAPVPVYRRRRRSPDAAARCGERG